jgi:hypothetical protein
LKKTEVDLRCIFKVQKQLTIIYERLQQYRSQFEGTIQRAVAFERQSLSSRFSRATIHFIPPAGSSG